MIAGEGDIARMALKRGDQRFGGVIPDLDGLVVRGSEQIWLVCLRVVVDVIDPFGLMCFQRVIGVSRAKAPYLDSPIQASRSEGVGVFRIDGHAHHIVAVPFVHLHAFPSLVPIPELHGHIIGGSENEGL